MEKDYTPKHQPTAKPVAPAQIQAKKTEAKPAPAAVPEQNVSATKPETTEAKPTPTKVKKSEATAHGRDWHASKKHCMYICEFIKGKTIETALLQLNEVLKFKRPIPMRGEIPHRSYPGVMSGRYPVKVTAMFVQLLKGLKGNATVNGVDTHTGIIYWANATWASRPAKKGGARFKRAHVTVKLKEPDHKENKMKAPTQKNTTKQETKK